MHIVFTHRHKLHATDHIIWNDAPFEIEEVPERAENILFAIQRANLGKVVSPEDYGAGPILAVHDTDYVEFLKTIYAENVAYYKAQAPVFPETFATRPVRHKPQNLNGRKGYYCFGTGTPIIRGTWSAAYWSAQCALTGANRLLIGDSAAYALCRPPGHHAATDLYGGFCFLNNAAIAARFLGERTAILDIDYHHGNGTQEIFYRDPTVLYCSLHADPDNDYPYYWGGADERGEGPGLGTNRNFPLPPKINDAEYLVVLDEALEVIRDFAPRYLIVSLGLDIGDGDPVGGFCITTDGFSEIGYRISALRLPTLIVQEGGYLLKYLGQNAVSFLSEFAKT